MWDRGPTGGFVVPDELLRLAGDDDDTETRQARADRETADVALPGVGTGPPPSVRPQADLVLLAGAAVVAAALPAVIGLLAPDIRRSFHLSTTGVGAIVVAGLVGRLAAGPLAGLLADRSDRIRVSAAAAAVLGVIGAAAGLAPSAAVLALIMVVAGVASAPVDTAHLAYLSDAYPIEGRARVFSWHALAVPVAGTAGIFVMARLATAAASWRVAPVVLLLGVPIGLALRARVDPGRADADELPVTIGAAVHRLGRLRSVVALLIAGAVLGFTTVGLPLILSVYLERRWHQNLGHRGHVLLVIGLAAFAGLPAAGVLCDRLWRQRPERVLRFMGAAVSGFGLLIGLGASLSSLGPIEVIWFGAGVFAAELAVSARLLIAAVSPPDMRSSFYGLFGAYGLLIGGVAGTMVLSATSDATSPSTALELLAPVLAAAGVVIALGAPSFRRDAELAVRDERDQTRPSARGSAIRALEVRHLDFAYGTRQVLFDVNWRVAEGEVAALLGTNGAGKSTLLRAVAGLDHPIGGTIRLFGRNTTYLEAEQIVSLGVAMLPGGKMTFPSLTVAENLRVAGHRMRRQRARLAAATEEVMALFPVLAERRNQRAGTLSGGEQQMLALGRVLLSRPRLVLIDELTLGLAPMVVESLLAIVRRINEEGATVLLVEQSVNLALSLAGHAVFLERGEIRFDGRTSDLLQRDDLLRPVFLGGS